MPDYPKRESFHAMRVIRKMAKSCAAQEIGPTACLLVVLVAVCEDVKRYTGPVTYFNDQLKPIMGIHKWETLARARQRAVDAGWLYYEAAPNGSRLAGKYWTTIPEWLSRLDDSPIDEHEACPQNGDDTPKADTKNGYARGEAMGEARGYGMGDAQGDARGELSNLSLNPDPDPSPVPTTSNDVKKRHTYLPEFETWWKSYPRHRRTEKLAAFKEWKKALARVKIERAEMPEQAHHWLQLRVEAYAASGAGQGEYTPAPKRWLANGRYDDDPASWERNGDTADADDTFRIPLLSERKTDE